MCPASLSYNKLASGAISHSPFHSQPSGNLYSDFGIAIYSKIIGTKIHELNLKLNMPIKYALIRFTFPDASENEGLDKLSYPHFKDVQLYAWFSYLKIKDIINKSNQVSKSLLLNCFICNFRNQRYLF